jgi:transposase
MRAKGAAEELTQSRQRAMALVGEFGCTAREAPKTVGVQHRAVNKWLSAYREEGDRGITLSYAGGKGVPSVSRLSATTRSRDETG